jgi:hypothetical protein
LNEYKAGMFAPVADDFWPHVLKQIHANGSSTIGGAARDSRSLFKTPSGESVSMEYARRRQIAVEEIDGTLAMIWPGQSATDKRMRIIIREALFQTRSETAISHLDPLVLESGVKVLHAFEATLSPEKAGNESEVIATIEQCKDLQRESEKVSAF